MSRKPKSVSQLKRKLDRVFSEYIRRRDKGRCFTCGNRKEWKCQQAGHYVRREHNATRYCEKNVNCQCAGCNVFKAGNMDEYALRLQRKYGSGILVELNRKKHQIKRFKVGELDELIEKYQNRIKQL